MYKLDDKVTMTEEAQEHYGDDGREYVITHIATNESQHPGYDSGMENMPLYDLATLDGKDYPNSLYEYELN